MVRVLFMHGLESGPKGTKVRYLRQHFEVDCPDMQMSAYNPFRRNSPMRHLILLLGGTAVLVSILPPHAAQIAALAGIAAIIPMVRWRLRVALANCTRLQAQVINKLKPDVVVASSWGG